MVRLIEGPAKEFILKFFKPIAYLYFFSNDSYDSIELWRGDENILNSKSASEFSLESNLLGPKVLVESSYLIVILPLFVEWKLISNF